jgi:CRISPR/Cas system-associated exonuclease Cas4 (RecB family)
MDRGNSRVIRASEVGQYAYCARAWWLARVLGYRSSHQEAMDAGTTAHERHGRAVVSYHRLQRAEGLLLVIALMAAVILLWLLLRG